MGQRWTAGQRIGQRPRVSVALLPVAAVLVLAAPAQADSLPGGRALERGAHALTTRHAKERGRDIPVMPRPRPPRMVPPASAMMRESFSGSPARGSSAQANIIGRAAGRALRHADRLLTLPTASCPVGVPAQTITVINQANVRPWALAKVENAVVAQSMQLRAAWGTPCVQFGRGGWPLYLQVGDVFGDPHGEHFGGNPPYARAWTSGGTWEAWSVMFSHEVIEMLVDPGAVSVWHDGEGVHIEVADPVENQAYRLDGVYVTDFVLPSWYAGGMRQAACDGSVCSYSDPLPGSGDGAPYDFARVLSAPWQLAVGVDPANVEASAS